MKELWFLHFAHCLMLIDLYMKFHEDSLNSFQVIERTQFCNKSPREITQKDLMQELWFLCSALGLTMLTDIYMEFLEDSLNNFQAIEQTQF